MITSLQSNGDDPTRFHPHLHSLVTQDPVSPEGSSVRRCSGPLKIISLIGDAPVIEKILRHLKLWNRPKRPPPPAPERSLQYDQQIADFDEAGQWPDATG